MERFARRRAACRERLRAAGADGLVCPPGPNCRYLSGYAGDQSERAFYLLVPARGGAAFVAPELAARPLADTDIDTRTYADGEDPAPLLGRVVREGGFRNGTLLVDPGTAARFVFALGEALPGAALESGESLFAGLRVRKDESELASLREAAGIADGVAREVRDFDAVGWTERELAREIERRLAERGGKGIPFDTVVAAGPNGGDPHHHPDDTEIRAGDPVVLDFGTEIGGYPSDQTRTVVFDGDPPSGFADAFRAVRDAQEAAVGAVEPGVEAGAVDAAARSVLAERGYGDAFVHRTGHGVGLEIHEEPYVVAGNDRALEQGMVFSVEPGIYTDDFGVRIEDLVVVTDGGCERLNDSPRGWA
jgi:Xaa-Pro aminopeptidase